MQFVSEAFKKQLTRSHRMAVKAEVFSAGLFEREMDIVDGGVSIGEGVIRRGANVSFADPKGDLTPADGKDLFAPFGNTVKLQRGLYLPNQTEPELKKLGLFEITDVTVDDSGEGLRIELELFDFARRVSRAKLPRAYTILRGANYGTAIFELIDVGVPGLTYNFETVISTTPLLVFEQGADRWEKARIMAASVGMDLFFDPDGVCSLRSVPPITDQVDWTYRDGEDATILSTNKKLSNEQAYNHVIVTGEALDNTPPVFGEAMDTNPNSPTYIFGPYGDVPYFFASKFVTTTEQATAAAQGILNDLLGATEIVRFNAIVNPAHDYRDIVYVDRNRSRINSRYVMHKLNIPLTQDRAMDVSTRERKL